MDALRNQIVERKVIDAIMAEAKVTEEKVKREETTDQSFAVYHHVVPVKGADIPEACTTIIHRQTLHRRRQRRNTTRPFASKFIGPVTSICRRAFLLRW